MSIRKHTLETASFLGWLFLILPLLLLTSPAIAQNNSGGLPDSVRLVRRGKVGDFYNSKSSAQSNFDMTMKGAGLENEQTNISEEHNTKALRVLSIGPEENIKIKEAMLSGTKTTETNGERSTIPVDLKGSIEVWTPSNIRLSRIPVTPPKVKSKGSKVRAQSTKQTDSAKESDEEALSHPPSFPEKELHVGDTWSGTLALLPDTLSDTPDVNFTAQLDAIEMHSNVPCAKVTYKLEKNITELPQALRSKLPASASTGGSMKIEGTVTDYYTLDRGMSLASTAEMSFTMRYTISVTNPSNNAVVNIELSGKGGFKAQEEATKFPAYDAALLGVSK